MSVGADQVGESLKVAWAALDRRELQAKLVGADDRAALVRAAEELLSTVSGLLEDEALWSRLHEVDELSKVLESQDLARIREILASELGILLAALGYRPPPPLLQFREEVHRTLVWILDPSNRETGRWPAGASEAWKSFYYLQYRLRELLERSAPAGSDAPTTDEFRDVVGSTARIVSRISPATVRVVVGTVIEEVIPVPFLRKLVGGLGGEAAGWVVGALVARGAVPSVVEEVKDLQSRDHVRWDHELSANVYQLYERLARALVVSDARIRIGDDAAMLLAQEQVRSGLDRLDALVEFTRDLEPKSGWGSPVDLEDIVGSEKTLSAKDSVRAMLVACERALEMRESTPSEEFAHTFRAAAAAAETALFALEHDVTAPSRRRAPFETESDKGYGSVRDARDSTRSAEL